MPRRLTRGSREASNQSLTRFAILRQCWPQPCCTRREMRAVRSSGRQGSSLRCRLARAAAQRDMFVGGSFGSARRSGFGADRSVQFGRAYSCAVSLSSTGGRCGVTSGVIAGNSLLPLSTAAAWLAQRNFLTISKWRKPQRTSFQWAS